MSEYHTLEFKRQHKSIEAFEAVDLPELTILTGLNGSGKTHLLEALANGAVSFGDVSNKEVSYIHLKDFLISNNGAGSSDVQIEAIAKGAWDILQSKIKSELKTMKERFLKDRVSELIDQCKKLGKYLWDITENDIGDDYLLLKQYKEIVERFLLQNTSGITDKQMLHSFYRVARKIDHPLDDITKENFFTLFQYSNSKVDLLPHNLADVFSLYYKKYDDNLYRRWRNEKGYSEVEALSDEKFRQTYGPPPWELINQVIKDDFNQFTYQVNSPVGLNRWDQFELKLIHASKSELTISVDQLSSGEQIMIALIVTIYQASTNNIFPKLLLFDEVDATLHPSMIRSFLKIVDECFIKNNIKVVIVTHSPTTVAFAAEESLFVMNKDGSCRIQKKSSQEAMAVLSEGFVSITNMDSNLGIAYNLEKTDLPVLLTEGITDKIILESAWSILHPGKVKPFYIQDCFCASFLGNLFINADQPPDGLFHCYTNKKFIALFDFDSAGFDRWNGFQKKTAVWIIHETDACKGKTLKHTQFNGFVLLLPVPPIPELRGQIIKSDGSTYEHAACLTIEHFAYESTTMNTFFHEEEQSGGGKKIKGPSNNRKREFANECKTLSAIDLRHYQLIFDQVEQLISI